MAQMNAPKFMKKGHDQNILVILALYIFMMAQMDTPNTLKKVMIET